MVAAQKANIAKTEELKLAKLLKKPTKKEEVKPPYYVAGKQVNPQP